jgi:hypothetical protein
MADQDPPQGEEPPAPGPKRPHGTRGGKRVNRSERMPQASAASAPGQIVPGIQTRFFDMTSGSASNNGTDYQSLGTATSSVRPTGEETQSSASPRSPMRPQRSPSPTPPQGNPVLRPTPWDVLQQVTALTTQVTAIAEQVRFVQASPMPPPPPPPAPVTSMPGPPGGIDGVDGADGNFGYSPSPPPTCWICGGYHCSSVR